jgi:glucokinase
MRAALVSSDATVSHRSVIPTQPETGIEDGARRLAALIRRALAGGGAPDIAGVGIATAGPLNPATGIYNHPPNLQAWHGKTMKPLLERDLGMPVWIGHDATLAAFAETQAGPHRGARDLIYVTVSTGVGGGIVANGEMVTGQTGGAGEVGHIAVRPGGLKCNVGCDGCLEGNTCGPAIARMAASRLNAGEKGALWQMAGGDPARVTSQMVIEAATAGDRVAAAVVGEVIENIGIGLGSLLNALEPEALVIGGGVVEGLKPRIEEIRAATLRHALPRYRDRGVPLSITTHGDDVSLLGAAFLVFRQALPS